MVKVGNMSLRLFAAVATIVFLVLACDQVADETLAPASLTPKHLPSPTPLPESSPTHTPSISLALSQEITPFPTQAPNPTVIPTRATYSPPSEVPVPEYSGQQIDEWYKLVWKPPLPWIWGSYIRHEDGLIGLSISCENKVEITLQALEGVGIPSDAIRIEVIKRPRPTYCRRFLPYSNAFHRR